MTQAWFTNSVTEKTISGPLESKTHPLFRGDRALGFFCFPQKCSRNRASHQSKQTCHCHLERPNYTWRSWANQQRTGPSSIQSSDITWQRSSRIAVSRGFLRAWSMVQKTAPLQEKSLSSHPHSNSWDAQLCSTPGTMTGLGQT